MLRCMEGQSYKDNSVDRLVGWFQHHGQTDHKYEKKLRQVPVFSVVASDKTPGLSK